MLTSTFNEEERQGSSTSYVCVAGFEVGYCHWHVWRRVRFALICDSEGHYFASVSDSSVVDLHHPRVGSRRRQVLDYA